MRKTAHSSGKLPCSNHLLPRRYIGMAVLSASPANAQTVPTTSAGTLTCQLAPSIGLIIGSRQRMACRFVPNGPYPPEAYVGVMGTIGLDIGITAGGVLAWGVLAPTAGPMRGRTRRDLCRQRAAQWVSVWVSAQTFCSVDQIARSRCSHFRSRDPSASISRLEFPVSRLPWLSEDITE